MKTTCSSSSSLLAFFQTNFQDQQKPKIKSNKKVFSFFSVTTSTPASSVAAINNVAFIVLIVITIAALPSHQAQAFNDEKGILKWNPYWFSNFRYSAPSSFYISPNRVGTPYKRVSEPTGTGSSATSGGGIYKWSPEYFSGGLQQPSAYLGSSRTGMDGGYMYSPNRPRWSLSDYFGSGGNRYLTSYYGGNSIFPQAVPRSSSSSGIFGAPTAEQSVIDLAGSNDLSALLGEELMNNGLGLENDAIDVLDGERSGAALQHQKAH